MKKILLLIIASILLLTGCNDKKENVKIEKKVESDYSLNEVFNIMNFQITVNSDIDLINDNDGNEIIKIPVEVKNLNDESGKLSMFYYKFYNSYGEEIESKGSNYSDSLDYASSLNHNESYVKYLYYPKGDNKYYYIEFNDTFSKYKVGIEL